MSIAKIQTPRDPFTSSYHRNLRDVVSYQAHKGDGAGRGVRAREWCRREDGDIYNLIILIILIILMCVNRERSEL